MRYVNFLISTIILFSMVSCASLDCKPTTTKALPGTETAVVGIYIDKNGYPQANIDTVRAYPGQKIVFVGPNKFDIFFKDQKSPTDRLETSSDNGIVTIEIPRDVFERDQRQSKITDVKKELLYRYGIRANGKITDPNIIIDRR